MAFMSFLGDKIRALREENQHLQRHLAAKLELGTPMLSTIERGERKAKCHQVIKIAKLYSVHQEELLTLWLADKVKDVIEGEATGTNALLHVIENS